MGPSRQIVCTWDASAATSQHECDDAPHPEDESSCSPQGWIDRPQRVRRSDISLSKSELKVIRETSHLECMSRPVAGGHRPILTVTVKLSGLAVSTSTIDRGIEASREGYRRLHGAARGISWVWDLQTCSAWDASLTSQTI